jgi:hypothetical protein
MERSCRNEAQRRKLRGPKCCGHGIPIRLSILNMKNYSVDRCTESMFFIIIFSFITRILLERTRHKGLEHAQSESTECTDVYTVTYATIIIMNLLMPVN